MIEKEYCKLCKCVDCSISLNHCGEFVNGCSHCVCCKSEENFVENCTPKKLNDELVAKYKN